MATVTALYLYCEPVLCRVRLHEVLVGVEEDAPAAVDAGDPDGQDGGLEAGAEASLLRHLLVPVPQQEPDIIPPSDAHLQAHPPCTHFCRDV